MPLMDRPLRPAGQHRPSAYREGATVPLRSNRVDWPVLHKECGYQELIRASGLRFLKLIAVASMREIERNSVGTALGAVVAGPGQGSCVGGPQTNQTNHKPTDQPPTHPRNRRQTQQSVNGRTERRHTRTNTILQQRTKRLNERAVRSLNEAYETVMERTWTAEC